MSTVRKTTKEFIASADKVHRYFYDYTNVAYKNNRTKVTITCPLHGTFSQTPNSHLKGQGCPECGKGKAIASRRLNTSKFIGLANSKHNTKYDYSDTMYIHSKEKVEIKCRIHGTFLQTPNKHLLGRGCPQCARVASSGSWTDTEWYTAALRSTKFRGFTVYCIECFNDTEQFYKIGKTYNEVTHRFYGKSVLPYTYNIVSIYTLKGCTLANARKVSELERFLHREYKDNKYIPIQRFGGYTECFKLN